MIYFSSPQSLAYSYGNNIYFPLQKRCSLVIASLPPINAALWKSVQAELIFPVFIKRPPLKKGDFENKRGHSHQKGGLAIQIYLNSLTDKKDYKLIILLNRHFTGITINTLPTVKLVDFYGKLNINQESILSLGAIPIIMERPTTLMHFLFSKLCFSVKK